MFKFIKSNKSLLYPILVGICVFCQRLSGLGLARRLFGRYIAVELIILLSVVFGIIAILIIPLIPSWASLSIFILYFWRVLTMCFGQVAILLLNMGKSTPGELIHSRLRYLFLATLNFYEVVLLGGLSILILNLYVIVGQPHYSSNFSSNAQLLYYNFQIASGLGVTTIQPMSDLAFAHGMIVSSLGFLMLVVVLSIMLAIKSEDEAVTHDYRPSGSDYWTWRASRFQHSEWATSDDLRTPICSSLHNRKISSVVDVGCGVGHLCTSLAVEGFSVTGIDNSEGMVRTAKRQAHPGVNIQKGEANALPLADNSVDAVIMRMLLHNVLPEWQPALKEAKRVLKPGGLLLIAECFPPSENSKQFFSDVTNLVHPRHVLSENQIKAAIDKHGFQVIEEEPIVFRQMSVVNWVQGSTGDESVWDDVIKRHFSMPKAVKKDYNATYKDSDIFIDINFKLFICQSSELDGSFDVENAEI